MNRGAVVTAVLGVDAEARQEVARRIGRGRLLRAGAASPDRVAGELRAFAAVARRERLVLECGPHALAHDAMACTAAPGLRLGAVVAVVQAQGWIDDVATAGAEGAGSAACRRPAAVVAVDQVEHADAVVVAGWRTLPREELERLLALLAHLNPDARLTLLRAEPGWAAGLLADRPRDGLAVPGWVRVLNGEHDPFVTGGGVTAVRYEQLRPLHPGRLLAVLRGFEHRHGRLLRSAGLCRLATRPGAVARWDHVGRVVAFEPLAAGHPADEPVAIGQDLALIGVGLDAAGIAADLDRAALTDDELGEGPAAWARYPDPLPVWHADAGRP